MIKKVVILTTTCIVFISAPMFAKKIARNIKNSKSKAVSKTQTATKENKSQTPQVEKVKELTCLEKFNNCMDKVCLNSQGIRYNCSSSIDSFDTVKIGENKIRVGSDLYTYAKGSCNSTLKSCELKDRNSIETQYKAQIQTDVLTKNYMDAMAYSGEEASQQALDEFVQCMQPLCGPSFSDCFKISAVERRSSQCEQVLQKTGRPLAVKKAFYDELEKLNKDFCKKSSGYIDFDTKVCKVEVVFGKPRYKWDNGVAYLVQDDPLETELAKRYFNMGEMVECTQSYFATFYEENDNFAKGIVKLAQGVTRAVAGVVCTVVGVVATAFSGGAAKGLVGSGVKMFTNGVADTIDGAVILDDGQKDGACYIGGKYVAPMNQYFRINIVQ